MARAGILIVWFALIALSCGQKKGFSSLKVDSPAVTISGKLHQMPGENIRYLNVSKVRLGDDYNVNAEFVALMPVDENGGFELRLNDSTTAMYIFKQRDREISRGGGVYLPAGTYHIALASRWNPEFIDNAGVFFRIGKNNSTACKLKETGYDEFYKDVNQRDYKSTAEFDRLLERYFPYKLDIAYASESTMALDSFIVNRAEIDGEQFDPFDYREMDRFLKWISSIQNKKYRDYFILNQMRHYVYDLDKLQNIIDSLAASGPNCENRILFDNLKKAHQRSRLFRLFDTFPDVPLVDINGRVTSLRKIKQPFKLVSIFDDNCLPCIDDYKQLDTLQTRSQAIPAMIVVSRGQNYVQTIETHKKLGIDWENIYFVTEDRFSRFFGFEHFPSYYYLNKNDVIIKRDELHFGDGDPEYFNDYFGPFNQPDFKADLDSFYQKRRAFFEK